MAGRRGAAGVVVAMVIVSSWLVGALAAAAASPEVEGRRFRAWYEARSAKIDARIPALVARCMAKAGFPGLIAGSPPPDAAPSGLDVGYGLTALVDTDLPPASPWVTAGGIDAAAAAALFGTDDGDDAEPRRGSEWTSGAGCLGEAVDTAVGDVRTWDRLQTIVEGVVAAVARDPEVVAATTRWSECFETATGFYAESPDDAVALLSEELFWLLAVPSPDVTPAAGSPTDEATAAGLEAAHPGEGAPAYEDELADRLGSLDELRAREVAWAAADRSCAAQHLDAVLAAKADALLGDAVRTNKKLLAQAGYRAKR